MRLLLAIITVLSFSRASAVTFNESCYLQRYPDVVKGWVNQGLKAIDHWTQHGQYEKRNPGCDAKSKNTFYEPCYLERYQDVLLGWVYKGGKAIDHWNRYGKNERRIPGCDYSSSNPITALDTFNANCYLKRYKDVAQNWKGKPEDHWKSYGRYEKRIPGCGKGVYQDSTSAVGPGSRPIQISIDPKFASAVTSLTWNGMEFINIHDHGRELQTAFQVDGFGECNNPTEAGSGSDPANSTSSQLIESVSPATNILKTKAKMAYWTFTSNTGSCSKGPDPRVKVALSGHVIDKEVTIGLNHDNQVIKYDVTITHPKNSISKTIAYEFLTGYLTPEFNRHWYVSLAKKRLIEYTTHDFRVISSGQGYGDGALLGAAKGKDKLDPVIFSTKDGSHAMGVYTSTVAMTQCGSHFQGYTTFKFNLGGSGPKANGTNKWSVSLWEPVKAKCLINNKRSFTVYLAIGTVEEVKEKLLKLAQTYP